MSVAFEPIAFLQLAQQLVGAGGSSLIPSAAASEAQVRTALGRTYDALYLLVRREISRRHGILYRHLQHGTVYTRLQSPVASDEVRRLGRNLEWMYRLRQKADYELDPDGSWREHLTDEVRALGLAQLAMELAALLPRLDFSPVVPLLQPGGAPTQPPTQSPYSHPGWGCTQL